MFMTTSSSEAPLVTASRTAAIFTAVGSYSKGKETTVATFTRQHATPWPAGGRRGDAHGEVMGSLLAEAYDLLLGGPGFKSVWSTVSRELAPSSPKRYAPLDTECGDYKPNRSRNCLSLLHLALYFQVEVYTGAEEALDVAAGFGADPLYRLPPLPSTIIRCVARSTWMTA